ALRSDDPDQFTVHNQPLLRLVAPNPDLRATLGVTAPRGNVPHYLKRVPVAPLNLLRCIRRRHETFPPKLTYRSSLRMHSRLWCSRSSRRAASLALIESSSATRSGWGRVSERRLSHASRSGSSTAPTRRTAPSNSSATSA